MLTSSPKMVSRGYPVSLKAGKAGNKENNSRRQNSARAAAMSEGCPFNGQAHMAHRKNRRG